MKHIDVIIISWAKDDALLQVTKDGLDSLFKSGQDEAFHAYIVESNKDIRYEDMPQYQKMWMHSVKTIHTDLPFGYHRYLNLGRRAGSSPYVVLCNSDLTYEKGWATEIIKVMEELPQFKSASPWCPQTQGPNDAHKGTVYEGIRVRGELAGWCIFQQRNLYDIIEELNEGVDFWFSDNIYADELSMRKISHCLVPDSVVNHHDGNLGKTGSSLKAEDQQKITMGEQSKYIESLKTLKYKLHIN